MKRELTCIICPRGCSLTVDINGDDITVSEQPLGHIIQVSSLFITFPPS